MNDVGPGTLELVGADLWETGAYDDACEGASCFIHTAAELGTLEGQTPQRVYDSGFKATQVRAGDALPVSLSASLLSYLLQPSA